MEATPELVETLKAGHTVRLMLGKTEPVQHAHQLFNRLEREHGLSVVRRPSIANGRIVFIIWDAQHTQAPEPVGY